MIIGLHKARFKFLAGSIFIPVIIISACAASPAFEQMQSSQGDTTLSPPSPTEALATALPTSAESQMPGQVGYPSPGDVEGYPAPEGLGNTPVIQSDAYPPNNEGYPIPPPLKTELEASDPSTVNLASGEIQLVEFFAFW